MRILLVPARPPLADVLQEESGAGVVFGVQREQRFETLLGVLRIAAAVADADAVLQKLQPNVLLETRRIQKHDVTGLEAVYHVVEHFSMHTGQIILLTKMMLATDLEFYDLSAGSPQRRW